jgi:hypothetical protein
VAAQLAASLEGLSMDAICTACVNHQTTPEVSCYSFHSLIGSFLIASDIPAGASPLRVTDQDLDALTRE